ncbi:metallophosphoesterase [Catenovulum sp. SM1970]|uniref:metallophosphoesterase n=1 Tax=Marinifaba aquimaris TaxID=2741323 RepID=UPI0015730E8F|nr:metallophosphoesterase [Marinifaba aquimaris]NTS77698.1 metallophosphoesterase [Marinifaba aquimaris]
MIKLAQISDFHLFDDPSVHHYQVNVADNFARVISYLHSIQAELNLVLMTGDMAQQVSADTYKLIANMITSYDWDIPFFWLLGNHDSEVLANEHLSGNPFVSSLKQSYFSFEQWQVVALDSTVFPSRGEGQLTKDNIAKLEAQLSASNQPTLLALHHHLLPYESFIDNYPLKNSQLLDEVLAKYPHVKAICHGHVHAAHHYKYQKVPCFSAPATSYQFKHFCDDFEIASIQPGFNLISLLDNTTVDVEPIWL